MTTPARLHRSASDPKLATPLRELQCQKRIADTPVMYQSSLKRVYNGQASAKAAIGAFCVQCVGGLRKDVTECSAYACPLWLYRPYQE